MSCATAPADLSDLLARARAGEDVVVSAGGLSARLMLLPRARPGRRFGAYKGLYGAPAAAARSNPADPFWDEGQE